MPIVNAGNVNVDYQMGLVKDGAIQHIAGYLPGDDGEFLAAVFTDLQPTGKWPNKKGLNLTAVPLIPNGEVCH